MSADWTDDDSEELAAVVQESGAVRAIERVGAAIEAITTLTAERAILVAKIEDLEEQNAALRRELAWGGVRND